jgi:Condensation domain
MPTPSKNKKSEVVIDLPPRMAATVSAATENGRPVLRRTPETTSTELSFAQQRLWFLSQINPHDSSVNVAHAVTVIGPLNQDVLHRSLQSLICRHESLRTTFATTELYAGIDSKPAQFIAATGSFALDLIEVSRAQAEDGEATARRLAHKCARHKFDLSLGPLARATLIRVNDQFHILVITAHRIVADEESVRVLFRELWQVYAAGGDLKASQLGPMPS